MRSYFQISICYTILINFTTSQFYDYYPDIFFSYFVILSMKSYLNYESDVFLNKMKNKYCIFLMSDISKYQKTHKSRFLNRFRTRMSVALFVFFSLSDYKLQDHFQFTSQLIGLTITILIIMNNFHPEYDALATCHKVKST